jgi:hypothetical protein
MIDWTKILVQPVGGQWMRADKQDVPEWVREEIARQTKHAKASSPVHYGTVSDLDSTSPPFYLRPLHVWQWAEVYE